MGSCLGRFCLFSATLLASFACAEDVPTEEAFRPYSPAPPAEPPVDEEFLQEFNEPWFLRHEGQLHPIVGVVRRNGLPVAITMRGWLEGNERPFSNLDADIVSAADSLSGSTYVATGSTVFRWSTNEHLERLDTPAEVRGLVSGEATAVAVIADGFGVLTDGLPPRWVRGATVSAAVLRGDVVFVAGSNQVSAHTTASADLSAPTWVSPSLDVGIIRALVADVVLPTQLDLVVIGDDGVRGFRDGQLVDVPEFLTNRVPLGQPRVASRTSDGGFVVGTDDGAYRIMDRGNGPEWRVYAAERWLPTGRVVGVATMPQESNAPIWFATPVGVARVTARQMTLEEKLVSFVDRITQRHDRDGAVADSHLLEKGNLSTNVPWDSDNDGSWTSYWLLAECFRWKVTGAPDAKEHFDHSLEAMLRLRDITGTDHFVARAVIRKEGCQLDDCDDPDDGRWYTSADGEWWIKRDTSNDEVIAHVFMMGHAYDLCANESQKQRIADHIGGIVGGIVDRGFQLIDPITGVVTTYGQFDPQYVNEGIAGTFGDGGLRSVEMLASLTLADYLTKDPKFSEAKRELIDLHHYGDNAVRESEYPFRGGNGDGDEMSTESWFVLLRYESDPQLRGLWSEGWRRTYTPLSRQRGAWWDLVDAVVGGEGKGLLRARDWLRRAPMDMVRWDVRNSMRKDLVRAPEPYAPEGRMRSDGEIIPYDERRCDRWNTDQFKVDGGMGAMIEMDGADVLAPYWMARYYGLLTKE